jgi:acetylornithine/N-succinyldiaminopimelate aminotransferase
VPIGAMLAGPRADLFVAGDHGTTFGGNPIACAAAVATLRTIKDEKLVEHAHKMGTYWHEKMQALCAKYDFIESPRGIGLIRAVNVKRDLAGKIVEQAMQHGLLLNAIGGDTLRIIPPLVITQSDLDEAAEKLDRTLAEIAKLA